MSKIYFIDDNKNLCLVWKLLFQRNHYNIEVFHDAESALENAQIHGYPDIVITDHNLPGISGIELLIKMKAVKPILPIVLSGDKERLQDNPNTPKDIILLSKPIQFECIKKIIEENSHFERSANF